MSEETAVETKAAKKPATVYTDIAMADGRTVSFPGDQKIKKSVLFADGKPVGVQFDYRSGETRTLHLGELDEATAVYAACHGLLQKIGDASAGVKEIEDITLAHDEVAARLRKGEWAVEREAGDSTAGASIVIKAIMEATGKDMAAVKAFLDGKIEAAKAKGEKLTRQALYASFRNPTSQVGKIIRRLEEEKAAKSSAVDADALLAEMNG
jgi:hypothetical protein